MQCPKCGFEQEGPECRRCGVIFAKVLSPPAAPTPLLTSPWPQRELIHRALALPLALLFARLAVSIAPGAVRLLSMWVHETGHAVAAWLSGYPALPGPWFTPVHSSRSPALTVLILAGLAFAAFRSWQKNRWGLVAASVVMAAFVLYCTRGLYSDQAQQLIVFGGDAGCLVLGAILMASFYVSAENPLHRNHVRWGFLIIGALAFAGAYTVWSGGIQTIPFGENENGLSDPSVLTELYGWSVRVLIDRYHRLAVSCLAVLGGVYVAGLAALVVTRGRTDSAHAL